MKEKAIETNLAMRIEKLEGEKDKKGLKAKMIGFLNFYQN
jgi:hypothetical protein